MEFFRSTLSPSGTNLETERRPNFPNFISPIRNTLSDVRNTASTSNENFATHRSCLLVGNPVFCGQCLARHEENPFGSGAPVKRCNILPCTCLNISEPPY